MPNNSPTKFIFKPQRKLGQNFLFDSDYLNKIVESCSIGRKTKIIEIGPGYGNLTKLLTKASDEVVISIEKDKRLLEGLNSNLVSEKANFVLGDALNVDWGEFIRQRHLFFNGDELIIVGNLPYNIANKLIENLLKERRFFKRFIFLVQKEVGQRGVASPFLYKNKYSNLSVFINYFFNSSLKFEIPKKFFKPAPPVDGVLVCLESKSSNSDGPDEKKFKKFFLFVRNCFRFRRKTLYNNLKSFGGAEDDIKSVFKKLNGDEKSRPQDLSSQEYSFLFNEFLSGKT